MLTPKEVEYWGKKKEDENYAFRAFLKRSADPADLDKRFRNLHEQLFADYDCSKCRNCCSSYHSSFADEELDAAAKELEISKEEFCKQYLEYSDEEQKFESKNVPCDFLGENGQCVLGDCRPVDCKDYPYTKRNDRLGSLFTIIEMTKICPVVYEMMERLKEEYDFLNESQSVIKTEKKTYPNDPCPCGSGKKYKRCCGRNLEADWNASLVFDCRHFPDMLYLQKEMCVERLEDSQGREKNIENRRRADRVIDTKPYYMNQTGWTSDEYYGLHRYLHRLILHYDRKKDEIQSMDIGRMSDETKVLLYCIIEYYHLEELFKLDNLSPLEKCVPLATPLVIGNHGINEENVYEKMNVVL